MRSCENADFGDFTPFRGGLIASSVALRIQSGMPNAKESVWFQPHIVDISITHPASIRFPTKRELITAMKTKSTYQQIQKQIDDLKKQAETVRRDEIKSVIVKIKEAITVYGLTAADLGFAGARAGATRVAQGTKRRTMRSGKAAVVRYRDDTGNTWVGRGKRPGWLRDALAAGRQLTDFAVK